MFIMLSEIEYIEVNHVFLQQFRNLFIVKSYTFETIHLNLFMSHQNEIELPEFQYDLNKNI